MLPLHLPAFDRIELHLEVPVIENLAQPFDLDPYSTRKALKAQLMNSHQALKWCES
jgi:hypothetical protein